MNVLNVYLNVKILSKKRGMKLGEIEDACGLSCGYLSRSQKIRNKGISVNTLIRLAEVLSVPIESLVNDPPVFTNADKFVMVFGIPPKTVCDPECTEWWDKPYKDPDEKVRIDNVRGSEGTDEDKDRV